MKKFLSCAFILAVFLCMPLAHGRSENMPQFKDYPILLTSAGNAEKTVHDAIVKAAIRRGWRVVQDTPNVLRLSLDVRGKHQVAIEVKIDGGNASVNYINSTNLNYSKDDEGRESIHPSYRKWVTTMLKDAAREAEAKVSGI
ncbi:MAG: hypothetical protein LBU43_03560 [Candidatus Accumulibacter sp.]|jgi:hypothetical protein|nr:hypothetical protein [Accumulibacter sp.]